MSNIILAGVVLLTLAFFVPAFQWLPETALVVVVNAMSGSASSAKVERLWRVSKIDFALAAVTFVVVLVLDLLPAMVVGIILSIIYMVYRAGFPGREVLGRVPETGDLVAKHWL